VVPCKQQFSYFKVDCIYFSTAKSHFNTQRARRFGAFVSRSFRLDPNSPEEKYLVACSVTWSMDTITELFNPLCSLVSSVFKPWIFLLVGQLTDHPNGCDKRSMSEEKLLTSRACRIMVDLSVAKFTEVCTMQDTLS
jgi:hypothetical protein